MQKKIWRVYIKKSRFLHFVWYGKIQAFCCHSQIEAKIDCPLQMGYGVRLFQGPPDPLHSFFVACLTPKGIWVFLIWRNGPTSIPHYVGFSQSSINTISSNWALEKVDSRLYLLANAPVPSVSSIKCRAISFHNPWDRGRVKVLWKESGKLTKICTWEQMPTSSQHVGGLEVNKEKSIKSCPMSKNAAGQVQTRDVLSSNACEKDLRFSLTISLVWVMGRRLPKT